MKSIKYIMLATVALASAVITTSCSDDDDSASSPISVSGVYLQDASSTVTVHNREVDFARLGQTIRIQGTGFSGLRHIYINGYDTYFNNALMTDNNVWVSLNSKTPIYDAKEEDRNTIRFVKDGTSFTYPFTVRAAAPSISSISNCLPVAGEVVYVYGSNLQETNDVTLPSGTKVDAATIANAVGEDAGKWFSFVMPAGETEGGSITAVCANGTAISPAYFNNNAAYIINFDNLGSQGYWSWSETGSMCDPTDLVSDPLGTGRGNVAMLVPQRLLDNGGIAAGKTRASEWWTAGNDNADDDWNWMISSGIFEGASSLENIAVQFDIYCPREWSATGQLQISIQNNISFNGYGSDESKSSTTQTYVWLPWIDETTGKAAPFKTEGWKTVTIPLSKFSKYVNEIEDDQVPTFQELVDDRNGGSYRNFGFGFVNSDITVDGTEYPASVFNIPVYVDNFRLVPCESKTVSDFPDEDEE